MGMIQEFQQADKERRAEVATMLSEADDFVKELAKGSAQRASGVASMLGDFAKGDAERRSEVAAMLSAADAFVRELAKGSAQRASEVATMLGDFAKGDAERRSEIATMLSVADAFVKELAKGSAQRASEVATMLDDLAKGDAERRSEVATIHQMVWGVAPARKMAAPPKVAPAPPVAELPKKMPPVGALRDRVFAYLADHPDGTKLAELEAEFGVSRIEMARVVRALMDNNKVEKRELLYFAI